MASLFINEKLPTSAEEAIRRFDERYNALVAAGPPPGWAGRFVTTVDSPRTTFPLTAFTSGFRETKEESGRYRSIEGKTFDLTVVEFDDGYEEKLENLISIPWTFQRWLEAASEFVASEGRHHAKQLAKLFEAGTTTKSKYDDVNFWSTAHLCNPTDTGSTTWSNYQSSAKAPTIANIEIESTAMQGAVLDVNGDKMEVVPDEIWLPTSKFTPVSNLLSAAFINGGDTNTWAGKLKPVHMPQLTDADDWILADSKLLAKYPAAVAAKCTLFDAKLGSRDLDENSDHFKKTGKLAKAKHIWAGYGLLFPHAVRLVRGA